MRKVIVMVVVSLALVAAQASSEKPNGQTSLPAGTETIGHLMQRAGYKTAIIGKWGLGSTWDSGSPNEQGFDLFFGYTDQRKAHNYYPEYLWFNGEKRTLNGEKYSHDLTDGSGYRNDPPTD